MALPEDETDNFLEQKQRLEGCGHFEPSSTLRPVRADRAADRAAAIVDPE